MERVICKKIPKIDYTKNFRIGKVYEVYRYIAWERECVDILERGNRILWIWKENMEECFEPTLLRTINPTLLRS